VLENATYADAILDRIVHTALMSAVNLSERKQPAAPSRKRRSCASRTGGGEAVWTSVLKL